MNKCLVCGSDCSKSAETCRVCYLKIGGKDYFDTIKRFKGGLKKE